VHYETLVIEAQPDFDQVYFYLSFEGRPEQRFPADDSQFYTLISGHGQIQPRASADQRLTLPPLQDGKLDISGECWGWAGGNLSVLDKSQESILEAEMRGEEIVLGGPPCRLSFALQPLDGTQSLTTYGGNASGPPAPYDLKAEQQEQYEGLRFLPGFDWIHRYTRLITCSWDGNPNDLAGFTIYINGKAPYKAEDPKARKTTMILPDKCGLPSTWAVVANGKSGDSPNPRHAHLPLPARDTLQAHRHFPLNEAPAGCHKLTSRSSGPS
jgi:hypothetical protein